MVQPDAIIEVSKDSEYGYTIKIEKFKEFITPALDSNCTQLTIDDVPKLDKY